MLYVIGQIEILELTPLTMLGEKDNKILCYFPSSFTKHVTVSLCHGRDHMVVVFTTKCAISAYHH